MRDSPELTSRYELDRVLSWQGPTRTYRAVDPASGETVAVKAIALGTVPEAQVLKQRFLATAGVLRTLVHPNLPRLLDFGVTTDAEAYLVFEWIEGTTLDQLGDLAPRQVLPYVLQAIEGLECLALHGLVHLNLSPENLLVTHEGEVKLVGLGGSLLRVDWQSPLAHGGFGGATGIAAPELQLTASAGSALWRADLYALAFVTCALLGAEVDGAGTASPEVRFPPDIGAQLHAPEQLAKALARCLHVEPSQRPVSYSNLAKVLQHSLPRTPRADAVVRDTQVFDVADLASRETSLAIPPLGSGGVETAAEEAMTANEKLEESKEIVALRSDLEATLGDEAIKQPADLGKEAEIYEGFLELRDQRAPAEIDFSSRAQEPPKVASPGPKAGRPSPLGSETVLVPEVPSLVTSDRPPPAGGGETPAVPAERGAGGAAGPPAPPPQPSPSATAATVSTPAPARERPGRPPSVRPGREAGVRREAAAPSAPAPATPPIPSAPKSRPEDRRATEAPPPPVPSAPAAPRRSAESPALRAAQANGQSVAKVGSAPPATTRKSPGSSSRGTSAPSAPQLTSPPRRPEGVSPRRSGSGAAAAQVAPAAVRGVPKERVKTHPSQARASMAAGKKGARASSLAPLLERAGTSFNAIGRKSRGLDRRVLAAAAVVALTAVSSLAVVLLWPSSQGSSTEPSAARTAEVPDVLPEVPLEEPEPPSSQPTELPGVLQEAVALLDEGRLLDARELLDELAVMEEEGALDATALEAYRAVEEIVVRQRGEAVAVDLSTALKGGEVSRLRQILGSVSAAEEEFLSQSSQGRVTLADARRARQQLDAFQDALAGEDRMEALSAAFALAEAFPVFDGALRARERATAAVEAEIDTLIDDGRLEEADERLVLLKSMWPDRPGVEGKLETVRQRMESEARFDTLLAAARAAGDRGRPHEGIRLLDGARPKRDYIERFDRQRALLAEQLQELDAGAPTVRLKAGEIQFRKGSPVVVELEANDDYEVSAVTFWVRNPNQTDYTAVEARRVEPGLYRVEIEPSFHEDKLLRFWASVSDLSGHEGRLGNAEAPVEVKRKRWFR